MADSYSVGHSQADGRKFVRFSTGEPPLVSERLLVDTSTPTLDTLLTIIAAQVLELRAEAEFLDRLARVAALNLQFQTGGQFADRFREMYRNSSKLESCYLAWWILAMIAAGHLTDTQVRNAFSMTAGQWNTFKTDKVQPAADRWTSVQTTVGE